MNLRQLLDAAGVKAAVNLPLTADITGLSSDSRACKPGDLFIGLPGTQVDGGSFWPKALANGAVAALVSPQVSPDAKAPVLQVDDLVSVCARLAAAFYGYPAQQLKLAGVTGTNGKTTTTHLIEALLQATGQPTALLGTLYARWPGVEAHAAAHTTPFAIELQAQLAEALAAGSRYAVLEVSSHALAQGRVRECPFEVAVFTNLTQDHLDYHRDLEDYFQAKALLFGPDYLKGRAIVNLDDPYGAKLLAQIPAERCWTYSTHNRQADLWTEQLTYSSAGVTGTLHTPMGSTTLHSPLVGEFNVANVLAAVGAALHLGVSLETIAQTLPNFGGVPGRVERVQVEGQDISVIVDYAHTPDSLENVLRSTRPFIAGELICVFGCGGDRDRTKRPRMGEIAARLSDRVYVTSDNPRTEDPQGILQDILAGIPASVDPVVEVDRRQAIAQAIQSARPGDGVLIAGKGHEDYQILGTTKIHFDDREEARAVLLERQAAQT
ncbi:UDP-N-acetylmuramoyl-L-alanyl-D-glutamate--2,6-diaminopimelate ligase [Leptolyngbya sp. FACHB-261]|uniref:UDP-N-acetylmuramoyl-L-alanyl-D-glutamate--2, 6-diaminopimelate ligase n=1 Tax=Leptolyngbya sp. FACHB-261 TaxID=2692806 RepID=UPI00168431DD|nr:UDP-N-acetylmuramoyl-L-alanyl-D-glutamate--2,6-diaminopimelate ligase [Leptolyngbya sp. FACHB-261]MBD2103645.1 UDP-N-acetylmuramoyl-L-alanyl-D-glutamate--2,6-diaminopimelate ligase [Leptolyngbya sp. FACHB-261]